VVPGSAAALDQLEVGSGVGLEGGTRGLGSSAGLEGWVMRLAPRPPGYLAFAADVIGFFVMFRSVDVLGIS